MIIRYGKFQKKVQIKWLRLSSAEQHYPLQKIIKKVESEAREEGIKYGIAIGEERGRNEGAQQKAVETAKSMKLENMSTSMIAHFTGLSPEEIEKL